MQTRRNTHSPGDLRALGRAIGQQRTRRGLSTQELARTVGISYERLQNLEVGGEEPARKLLRHIADVLGVTPPGLMLVARELQVTGTGSSAALAQLRNLGQIIRQLRTEQHIDPNELADTLDISTTCLTDLEEGRYDPTATNTASHREPPNDEPRHRTAPPPPRPARPRKHTS